MIYRIFRLSDHRGKHAPVECATKHTQTVSGIWQGEHFEREEVHWTVEIKTLAELNALQKHVKDSLVISHDPEGHPQIIIYDDYME